MAYLYGLLFGKIVNESDFLIFLDVISLFTNIPLDVAIDGRRWIYIQHNTNRPKNDFISAIKFVFYIIYF